MEFRLLYDGDLKGGNSKDRKHIQSLRRHFHTQLSVLWDQSPLKTDPVEISHRGKWLRRTPQPGEISHIKELGNFVFAPLVTANSYLFAELDILFLRPGPPGNLLDQGGDLDNRVKTLIDSLRMPAQLNELPDGDEPKVGEEPFFCLLEDDKLISGFSVTSDRLLRPNTPRANANLIVKVRIRASIETWDNSGIAS